MKPKASQFTPGLLPADSHIAQKAAAYLAQREHSKAELCMKLGAFFGPFAGPLDSKDFEKRCREVLNQLAAKGLQSDARFAALWIRSKLRSGKGRPWIERGLQQKGLSQEVMAEAWLEVEEDAPASEDDRALSALKSHFKEPEAAPDQALRNKYLRFLASRGFSFEVAKRACQNFFEAV